MRTELVAFVAGLLVVQMAFTQQTDVNPAIQQRIAELPANAHVAVHLTAGKTIRGRIGSTGGNNFVLRPDGGSERETIAYTQVSSVDQIKAHSRKKWIIIGVVAAVVVVGVIAIVIVHNGPGVNLQHF